MNNEVVLLEIEDELKNKIVEIVERYLYADSGKSEIEVTRELFKQVRDVYDI